MKVEGRALAGLRGAEGWALAGLRGPPPAGSSAHADSGRFKLLHKEDIFI